MTLGPPSKSVHTAPAASPHVIRSLPILILYPHSRCNCRCVMCDIWKVSTAEEISAEELRGYVADIEALDVRWVVFSGGEPLMHSDLFRLAGVLGQRGIRTTALTTGLLLERDAQRIVDCIDDVIVSLDGPEKVHDAIRRVPGAYQELAGGVRALHGMKPGYSVAGRCTVQKANYGQLRATVEAAKQLGLHSISFLAADLTSEAFNRPGGWREKAKLQIGLTPRECNALEAEMEQLISGYRGETESGFIRESATKLRGIVHHFRAELGLAPALSPPCNAPWVSAVVESDGTLRPCFFHRPVGNVREQGLLGALNSPEAVAFRGQLDIERNEICRRCVCSLHLRNGGGI